MIKRRETSTSFVDLLFIISLGFLLLLFIILPFLNPIAKSGTIDPPVLMMVEMTWDDNSDRDIDLHMQGPVEGSINFLHKDNGYMTLKKDDLGTRNDSYVIDGQTITIKQNYEIVTMAALPDGWYAVNVHYYSTLGEPLEVCIKITNLARFGVAFDGCVVVTPRQEKTVISFRVIDNKVVDLDATTQRTLRREITAG